jgi:hypothetical protein
MIASAMSRVAELSSISLLNAGSQFSAVCFGAVPPRRRIAASADIQRELDTVGHDHWGCARIRQTLACIATICFHIELFFCAHE